MLMRTDSEASSEQMPQDAGQDDESVSPMMGGSQQNWGDVFAALDRNADGVITREEFVDAFMRSGGAIVGNDFPPLIVPVQMYETMYVPREVSEEAFRASQAAAAAGSTFPFHDAAFGAHFRNKSQGDYFDNELLSVKPDARPPLEELLLTALREAQRQERVKHNKRLAERLKHKAMEAAHLGSFDDDYDEVKMPDVFAENAENDKQKSMAMTYVSPDPEYKGFIYWLS